MFRLTAPRCKHRTYANLIQLHTHVPARQDVNDVRQPSQTSFLVTPPHLVLTHNMRLSCYHRHHDHFVASSGRGHSIAIIHPQFKSTSSGPVFRNEHRLTHYGVKRILNELMPRRGGRIVPPSSARPTTPGTLELRRARTGREARRGAQPPSLSWEREEGSEPFNRARGAKKQERSKGARRTSTSLLLRSAGRPERYG